MNPLFLCFHDLSFFEGNFPSNIIIRQSGFQNFTSSLFDIPSAKQQEKKMSENNPVIVNRFYLVVGVKHRANIEDILFN